MNLPRYLGKYITAETTSPEQIPGQIPGLEAAAFGCVICLETLEISCFPVGKVTSACTHDSSVCTPCLRFFIAASITDVDWSHPTCPQCLTQLSYAEIGRFVDLEILTKYDNRIFFESLSVMANFRWCPKEGCGSGQLHDGGEDSPIVTCRKCGDKMCFVHSIEWHEGDTCAEFQAKRDADKTEQASQRYLEKTTKTCPNAACGIRVEKISGCDHMICLKCRHEYCWLCLAAYNDIRSKGNHFHKGGCKHYRSY